MLRLISAVQQRDLVTYGGGLVTKSCLTLVTPWIVACQACLSMGFSRQEYCNGLPFPPPGNLPDPGMEAGSPALQADSLPAELDSVYVLTCDICFSLSDLLHPV